MDQQTRRNRTGGWLGRVARRDSLAAAIALWLALVGGLPIVVIAVFLRLQVPAAAEQSVTDNLTAVASEIAADIDRTLRRAAADIRLLADDPVVRSSTATADQKAAALQRSTGFSDVFETATLFDADGNVVAATADGMPENAAEKPWYREALAGASVVSNAYRLAAPPRVVMVYAEQVRDESGRVAGVIAGYLDLERIWEVTDAGGFGESGEIRVVDGDGRYVARRDRDALFNMADIPEPVAGGRPGKLIRFTDGGVALVAVGVPLSGVGAPRGEKWTALAVQKEAEAFAFGITQGRLLLWSFGLAIVVVIAAAALLARRIVRPIVALTAATRRISEGDFAARVPAPRRDELGRLAGSFNEMARALQEAAHIRESSSRLRRLHDAGTALSSTLDATEVVRQAAGAAVRVLAADVAVAVSGDGGNHASAVASAARRDAARLRDSLGQALASESKALAAASTHVREPLFLESETRDGLEDAPEPIRRLRRLLGGSSFAVVPLIVGDKTSGVIAAVWSRARRVSMEDRLLARLLGIQTAVALRNARQYAEAQREAEHRAVLAEIGRLMSSSLAIEEVYERFARLVRRMAPFDRIAIARPDLEAGTLTTAYFSGVDVPGWEVGVPRPIPAEFLEGLLAPRAALRMDQEMMEWATSQAEALQDIVDAGLKSTLVAPVFARDRPVAVLALNSRASNAYGEAEMALVEQVAAQIGGALANAELRAELEREIGERRALAEIARTVSSSFDLGDVYANMARALRGLVPYDRFVVFSIDPEHNRMRREFVDGLAIPGRNQNDAAALRGTIVEAALKRRAAVIVGRGAHDDSAAAYPLAAPVFQAGIRSLLVAPLFAEGDVVGALSIGSLAPDAYASHDAELAERIGAQVGGAVANARLHAALQKESRERVQRLEEINTLRIQFLRMVTHEFRTPLASMRVSRDLLAETPPGAVDEDVYRRLVANMGRGVDRLDRLVNDLLDLTIAQAGELKLQKNWVGADTLIESVVELISPLAAQRGQRVEVDLPARVPVLYVDRQRIEQALLNLLGNAQKFSDENATIIVSTRRTGEWVEIRVCGKGPDIPERDRAHVFEPFFRGSGETARRVEGRGLGLSIAKAFVELHGGKIGLAEHPGRGPCFYFTLPREKSNAT